MENFLSDLSKPIMTMYFKQCYIWFLISLFFSMEILYVNIICFQNLYPNFIRTSYLKTPISKSQFNLLISLLEKKSRVNINLKPSPIHVVWKSPFHFHFNLVCASFLRFHLNIDLWKTISIKVLYINVSFKLQVSSFF